MKMFFANYGIFQGFTFIFTFTGVLNLLLGFCDQYIKYNQKCVKFTMWI